MAKVVKKKPATPRTKPAKAPANPLTPKDATSAEPTRPTEPAAVLALLLSLGNQRDQATLYANSYCEYQEAQANIAANGAVAANPRTGAPMDNPYLKVRDKAEAKLLAMGRRMKTEGLW
ncbi:P27 family phage terminase small subunit [Aureliella helgolandensis]|uniref:Phage terminase, small subunit n=1 Tax=Aureliella helgolandensis TaxID=2527968 RepID=A0A518GDW7_9BACT|nr:P27 family phage terminase small subunit [Aureliella helgolandensis]QDV26750.1 hypothetical protein Q31a_51290 [Aureliella helgolandensis]